MYLQFSSRRIEDGPPPGNGWRKVGEPANGRQEWLLEIKPQEKR